MAVANVGDSLRRLSSLHRIYNSVGATGADALTPRDNYHFDPSRDGRRLGQSMGRVWLVEKNFGPCWVWFQEMVPCPTLRLQEECNVLRSACMSGRLSASISRKLYFLILLKHFVAYDT